MASDLQAAAAEEVKIEAVSIASSTSEGAEAVDPEDGAAPAPPTPTYFAIADVAARAPAPPTPTYYSARSTTTEEGSEGAADMPDVEEGEDPHEGSYASGQAEDEEEEDGPSGASASEEEYAGLRPGGRSKLLEALDAFEGFSDVELATTPRGATPSCCPSTPQPSAAPSPRGRPSSSSTGKPRRRPGTRDGGPGPSHSRSISAGDRVSMLAGRRRSAADRAGWSAPSRAARYTRACDRGYWRPHRSRSRSRSADTRLDEAAADFAKVNGLDRAATKALAGCPRAVQQRVMRRGDLLDARNKNAVLTSRIGAARVDVYEALGRRRHCNLARGSRG